MTKNEYFHKSSIISFLQRQYEPYIKYRIKNNNCKINPCNITQDGYQSEIFYKKMLEMSEPHISKNDLVLDLGCALGRMSAEYSKKAKYVIGLDYSNIMVEFAKKIVTSKKNKEVDIPIKDIKEEGDRVYIEGWGISNCGFLTGNALAIPFKEELFDFTASINLLDRVISPKKMIFEILRILKPGGRLLISTPYNWSKEFTPDEGEWTCNMRSLFNLKYWNILNELDGLPSFNKTDESVTYTHILIMEKK